MLRVALSAAKTAACVSDFGGLRVALRHPTYFTNSFTTA